MDWLLDNLLVIIIAVCYVLTQSKGISAQWTRRGQALMDAMQRARVLGSPEAVDLFREDEYSGDAKINAVLDIVKPKASGPRVSKGRKILDGVMNLIPLVGMFRR